MSVLQHLEPQNVFALFEQLCAIPHGSGNTDRIADWVVDFAHRHNLRHVRDAANNVVLYKEASTGYEDAPTVILQGHLDMVCAKTPNCPLDMTREGVRVTVDGDWIQAEDTSLGGDNGIAVAMALAILADNTLSHPALEVVLTTDEETGMNGAFALDGSLLQGRRMLNIDSEEEGILTVSCAGGLRVDGALPVTRAPQAGLRCTVTVSGLLGGHSGVEIHKGRGNAIQLLGRVLYAIHEQTTCGLLTLKGGVVDNAIPLEATAQILIPADAEQTVAETVKRYHDVFHREYATTDGKVQVTFAPDTVVTVPTTDARSTAAVLFVLTTAPTGVQVMSADIPDLVQTSLNFGVLSLQDDTLHTTFSVRSSVETQKHMLRERLTSLFTVIGGSVTVGNEYPGWAYRKDSPLRDTVVEAYRTLYKQEPQVVAIHAGLECGLFSDKLPGLDCVSIGPNMQDIHTVNERLSISSSARTYQLVLEILKNSR